MVKMDVEIQSINFSGRVGDTVCLGISAMVSGDMVQEVDFIQLGSDITKAIRNNLINIPSYKGDLC